jgi:hypothetical protein
MAAARPAIARQGFFGPEPYVTANYAAGAFGSAPVGGSGFEADDAPVYEVTPNAIKRYQAMVVESTTRDLPDWVVIAAGGAFFALAGLLTGAWLHI